MNTIEDRIAILEERSKYIVELLEKQERRAKMGMIWKLAIFILVFVIPSYFTYKMFSGINVGNVAESVNTLKNLMP